MPVVRTPIESDEQWHALRAPNVGGSQIAALLGCHPYLTGYQLWAQKTGRSIGDIDNPAMERGREMEPIAIKRLIRKYPQWNVAPAREYWADPDLRIGVTPDCYADDPQHGRGIIQIKSVEPGNYRRFWIDDYGDVRVPDYVAIQAITEAWLTGSAWAAACAIVVGYGIEIEVRDVPIHDGIINAVRHRVTEFWKMVDAGTEPPVDYQRDGTLIADMLRQDDGTEIDLSGDNELPGIVARRIEASEQAKNAEAIVKECTAAILHRMGVAQRAKIRDGIITAKTIHRGEHLVKATSYRQVRIKLEEKSA